MMSEIKLGAQLFTLRKYIQNYEDTEKTFAYLNSIGINVIQISGIGPIEPERVAELVKRYDMDVCITHRSFDEIRSDFDNVVEAHRLMGCSSIGIGSMPGVYRDGTARGIRAFIEDSGELARRLKGCGMQFAYHNHAFEFARVDGRTIMDMLIEDTDPDCFHFIPDTHWIQVGGCSPAAFLRRIKGRFEVCHFKDYQIFGDGERRFAEIGTGNLDLDDCYEACKEAGAGYIVIEQDDTYGLPEYESMRISYENLLKIAARHE